MIREKYSRSNYYRNRLLGKLILSADIGEYDCIALADIL